jgi:hypothetical protein
VTLARIVGVAIVASTVLTCAGSGADARAASLVLGEADKQEALRAGERSVTEESFGAEWTVQNGAGESVTVMTPFHRLALAARHATFRNEPMKPGEPDRVLREQGERLVLWAELTGDRPDFARFYKPELVVGGKSIRPTFVQNERTALKRDRSYLARCVYGFPIGDVPGTATVALVVRDADGRDLRRFSIDLSTMR